VLFFGEKKMMKISYPLKTGLKQIFHIFFAKLNKTIDFHYENYTF